MSTLLTNIPNAKVYVRKEYLMDHQEGHGEFVEGHWVTAKSIPVSYTHLTLPTT